MTGRRVSLTRASDETPNSESPSTAPRPGPPTPRAPDSTERSTIRERGKLVAVGRVAVKDAAVVELGTRRRRRVRGPRIGKIVGTSAQGILVDYPGNPHGPLVARNTVSFNHEELSASVRGCPELLLAFVDEASDQPVIVGVLHEKQGAAAKPEPSGIAAARDVVETRVDGRRVVLEAQEEIELRCGEASITLRRNGRVVIRGAYVESRSRGVNRIRGGVVQVN